MPYRYWPCVCVRAIFFSLPLFCILGWCCCCCCCWLFFSAIQPVCNSIHRFNSILSLATSCFKWYNYWNIVLFLLRVHFVTFRHFKSSDLRFFSTHHFRLWIILFFSSLFCVFMVTRYTCLSHRIFVLGVMALCISGDVLCSHWWIRRRHGNNWKIKGQLTESSTMDLAKVIQGKIAWLFLRSNRS